MTAAGEGHAWPADGVRGERPARAGGAGQRPRGLPAGRRGRAPPPAAAANPGRAHRARFVTGTAHPLFLGLLRGRADGGPSPTTGFIHDAGQSPAPDPVSQAPQRPLGATHRRRIFPPAEGTESQQRRAWHGGGRGVRAQRAAGAAHSSRERASLWKTHTQTHAHACAHSHAARAEATCTCTRVCAHSLAHRHTHARPLSRPHASAHTHTHSRTQTHPFSHTHTHAHTYTPTNTQTYSLTHELTLVHTHAPSHTLPDTCAHMNSHSCSQKHAGTPVSTRAHACTCKCTDTSRTGPAACSPPRGLVSRDSQVPSAPPRSRQSSGHGCVPSRPALRRRALRAPAGGAPVTSPPLLRHPHVREHGPTVTRPCPRSSVAQLPGLGDFTS